MTRRLHWLSQGRLPDNCHSSILRRQSTTKSYSYCRNRSQSKHHILQKTVCYKKQQHRCHFKRWRSVLMDNFTRPCRVETQPAGIQRQSFVMEENGKSWWWCRMMPADFSNFSWFYFHIFTPVLFSLFSDFIFRAYKYVAKYMMIFH